MRRYIILTSLALLATTIACAGRNFVNTHVYSSNSTKLEEVYDPSTGQILEPDTWVLRSDGTFQAWILLDGEERRFSGTYQGDDAGEDFVFSFELVSSPNEVYHLYSGRSDEERFTFLEWEYENSAYRYELLGILDDG